MSAGETLPPSRSDGVPGPSKRRHQPLWVIVVIVVLVVAGMAVAITKPFTFSGVSHPGVADNADPTGLQSVTRQDLSSQTQASATLGYAGSYSVVNQAEGTLTSLPSVGQVISQGQALYRVDGAPVVLLYGATPAYRSLGEGITGTDVEELNADLVALGNVTSTELSPTSDEFSYWTACRAVGFPDA